MFWVEFRCREHHLDHFTLHTLCYCLHLASYFQSGTLGLLISSAAGKRSQHTENSSGRDQRRNFPPSIRAIQAEAQKTSSWVRQGKP